ncbi:alpha/beta fold hydrolase [Spongiactinospora sp. TRM90649]|uniref:alpha/beta fold hydrolase n=1 Tax=Spongiactinospora sp. TRM90649 TaxID=3031114 RepID=UPI0023F62034|nr:alpha/beta fold hydrolase [Spongiactinospora sp. TRM90649]MDF5754209.1 alpha/beta fold hydrolase [Spongiactinospora sp. TRM90649]
MGRSEGGRVLIEDFEDVVADVRAVEDLARAARPGVPVVVIGHSMGGTARYAQRHGGDLAALVLSGPVIGRWQVIEDLLPLPDPPDEPIDPGHALPRPRAPRGW